MEILILGRGISAKGLYKELSKDNNVTYAIEKYEELDNLSIYKDDVDINKYDYFYISPGVRNDDKLFINIKKYKSFSSEIEYALEKLKNHKIIAITGSNGKTTVASMLHDVLNKKNIKNVVCGNIGDPLINYVNVSLDTIIILEISSFQLEYLKHIKPYISIITNITPNHLDRHTYNDYICIKKKITLFQDNNDYLLINKKTFITFNFLTNAKTIFIKKKRIKNKYLLGNHNYENFGFIIQVMKILKVKNYKKILTEFKGVKYRLEYIGKYNKTRIYNDAKSTTPYSTKVALQCFNYNTLLIMGGKNKNIDYSFIEKINIKKIIMYGEEAMNNKNNNILKFKTLKDIFIYLKDHINEYKVILYSPGFTSLDQYNNYKERGNEFEKLCFENFKIK